MTTGITRDSSSPMDGRCSSLVELLQRRALEQPDLQAYTFLVDGETDEVHLTYPELDRQARAIATQLQRLGATGQRALLLYPPGLEYIAGFFGCLYAGTIAVPVYPPDLARLTRSLPRLQAILADAQTTLALTTAPLLGLAEMLFDQAPDLQALRWLATDELANDQAAAWQDPGANGDALAFLQYTSGSTAAPRGVRLTHRNLLHNLGLIYQGFQVAPDSRGVIWLPPYHDMGLIGGLLQPLYAGIPVVLLSPLDFLKRPLRWLQAISRYHGTISGGPNFAYDLCVRKIPPEERTAFDLRCWAVAFNGAEPVRADTLERFAAAFAPCGFRKEAFYPCYGLAEATLIVSGGAGSRAPITRTLNHVALQHHRVEPVDPTHPEAHVLVGCGQPLGDQRLVIVHPETLCVCGPDEVGEIWISGSSVAQGYWNLPEESARTFQAHPADTGEGAFLRTGDLGLIHEGELFITGRMKDLIIIRGRNYYPQDLERTVERSHSALRPGCGAAFSVQVDGEEHLVVVQEVDRRVTDLNLDEVIQAIRQAVAQEHELNAYGVVLLQAGSIPKTSSGKTQRHACRAGFLSESLDVVAQSLLDSTPADASVRQLEESFIRKALQALQEPTARHSLLTLYLQEQTARILRLPPDQLDTQCPVSTLGLDSLAVMNLKSEIETSLGMDLPLASFFEGQSLAQIATDLLARFAASSSALGTRLVPASSLQAESPLSCNQLALWSLYKAAPASAAHNIARAVRIRAALDISALRRALAALTDRHSSLRTTFAAPQGTPVQRVHDHAQIDFQQTDASGWSDAILNHHLSEQAHRPFDLERGPLLRIHLFTRSAQEHVLLLVVHRSVADLWSLAVLMHELGQLYRVERDGTLAHLNPPALQYADYVHWQAEMLAGPEGERLWDYWRQQLASELPLLNLPTDRPRSPARTSRGASQSFKQSADMVQKLEALGRAHGVTLYTTLLAAFEVLLHRYTGQADILVGSPTAGRGRPELASLVGCLANCVVLRADLAGNPTFTALLEQVWHTVLGALEHQDYPFALLVRRVLSEQDPRRSTLPQALFGLWQAPPFGEGPLGALALGEAGAPVKWEGLALEPMALEERAALGDLSLMVAKTDEGLAASWQYDTDLFDAVTIYRMAGDFQNLLQSLLAHPEQRVADVPLLSESRPLSPKP